MPRWRRRRLARLRRRAPRPADDHSWEVRPLREVRNVKMPLPASPVPLWGGAVPAGVPFTLSLDLDFQVVGMGSLRTCRECGQESVDGRLPPRTCREALFRAVMES